jgi:hypothetical protein
MISLNLESLSIELQPSYFVNTKKKDICTSLSILPIRGKLIERVNQYFKDGT